MVCRQDHLCNNICTAPRLLIYCQKTQEAVAVRNSLLQGFSGNFQRCWNIIPRFSGSTECYTCQGLGTFRQGRWLLENRPRLRERSWIFSSETATALLSFSFIAPCSWFHPAVVLWLRQPQQQEQRQRHPQSSAVLRRCRLV